MRLDVNDRGAKKWGSLMIPEFKDNLEKIHNLSIDHKSAAAIASLETLISLVIGKSIQVAIDYNPDGTVYEIRGYILKYHSRDKILHIVDECGQEKNLDFINIEKIELLY